VELIFEKCSVRTKKTSREKRTCIMARENGYSPKKIPALESSCMKMRIKNPGTFLRG
jgi:hypothetical protein